METLYRENAKIVYHFLYSLCKDEELSKDLTQDTFLKAYESLGRFDGSCKISTWLCQIAKNSYLSYLKKSGRIDNIEDAELLNIADPNETVEEKFVRHDEAVQIQKVLHDIPDPYKEVFMWRVFAELSFKQIGQIFGKSENWACVTYHRARNKIKERLEVDYHEE